MLCVRCAVLTDCSTVQLHTLSASVSRLDSALCLCHTYVHIAYIYALVCYAVDSLHIYAVPVHPRPTKPQSSPVFKGILFFSQCHWSEAPFGRELCDVNMW